MSRLLLTAIALTVVAPSIVSAAEEASFPPIGDRYTNVPEDAKAIVKSLKKLEARTEIGIAFEDYEKSVAETYPDIKVFIESVDSKDFPELRFLLGNAIDCHLRVRALWAESLSEKGADGVIKGFDFIDIQPALWDLSAVNVRLASALIDGPKEELPDVQRKIVDSVSTLTTESIMTELAKRRAGRAKQAAKAEAEAQLAAEAKAKDDLRKLVQQARAQLTGIEAPPADPVADAHDVGSLLLKDGELGEDVLVEAWPDCLEEAAYEMVPPANAEGMVQAWRRDQDIDARPSGGKLVGFIYSDTSVARKAFAIVAESLKPDEAVPGLGNVAAMRSDKGWTTVMFRRGGAVVSAVFEGIPAEKILAVSRSIDGRLRAVLPEGTFGADQNEGWQRRGSEEEGSKSKGDGAHTPATAIAASAPADFELSDYLSFAQELQDVKGEGARYAKTLIELTKTSTWKRKGSDAGVLRGRLARITAEGAVFETENGPVTVAIQELSADSGTKVARVRDICRRLAGIKEKAAVSAP